nr:PF20097 family protein [uncultured Oscillibacter sp.]
MKCPVCGKEMERGKVATDYSHGLFFLPPDGEIGFYPTEKKIEKRGGIVLDAPFGWNLPNEMEIPAYVCRECRKIVMEY